LKKNIGRRYAVTLTAGAFLVLVVVNGGQLTDRIGADNWTRYLN
jgi:hypothetical protein